MKKGQKEQNRQLYITKSDEVKKKEKKFEMEKKGKKAESEGEGWAVIKV